MPVTADHQATEREVRHLRHEVRRLEDRIAGLESDLRQAQAEQRWEAVHHDLYRERVRLTVVATIACAGLVLVILRSAGYL